MKIKLYYESKLDRDTVTLEVPDDQCEIMVETDYRQRLAQAKPEERSAVTRRDPQSIIDEECNKPTFNNNHAETRRHVALDALDPEGRHISDGTMLEEIVCCDNHEELRRAIAMLTPDQQALLRRVYWEKTKQRDIAREEGVDESAVAKRLSRIYARLRKLMETQE